MKMKVLFIGMTLLTCYFISCKKNKVEVIPEKTPDIYISGTDSQSRTVYWVNGKIYGTGADNQPGSMVVSGDDVYFLNMKGYQKNNLQIINVFGGAGFRDMAVSGDDVYIVGWGDTIPFYWKNGQKIKVESDLPSLRTSCIAVSDNKVYLAGTIFGGNMTNQIFYWNDGKYTVLGEGLIYKMKVDGNDVYILGQDKSFKGCYWKNGVKHQLYSAKNNIVELLDIYIKDEDVYVIGIPSPNDEIPLYWKNDQPVGNNLFSNETTFTSIAVYDKDVYLIGNHRSSSGSISAFICKNGIIDTLAIKTSVNKLIIK